MKKNKWFIEEYQGSLSMGFKYNKVLFEEQSPFQHIKIIETKDHGNMLINDNVIMTCDRDEFIYHEMITHVPLFSHNKPETVLVIGGGDGGSIREVLKHQTIKKCIMVEIDEVVVRASRKHLPKIATSFDHPLLELKFEDGASYIADKKNQFDVVIIDSSEPFGPSKALFGDQFYRNVYESLKEDGLVVAQGESMFYSLDFQKSLLKRVQKFKYRTFYNYSNLSYPNGPWSFLLASKKYHPLKDFSKQRVKQAKLDFRYYNNDIHQACFCHPQFSKKSLEPFCNL